MRKARRRLDLTGQRFGMLTVLAPAENLNQHTAWLCRCDCGNEKVVRTAHLRSGHTTSCGCRGLKNLTYVDGTCVEMLKAKTTRKNNTSGIPGVDWRPTKQRWRASICFQGKRYHLGNFVNFDEAVNARKAAEHALHDEFVRQYTKDHGSVN